MNIVSIIAIEGIPIVKAGDYLVELIYKAVAKQGIDLRDGDILVVTHKSARVHPPSVSHVANT
jgi:F420-0:gamma-glutamyl ligase